MQNMEKFLQAVNQGKYDDRLRRLYVFHDTQEELEAAVRSVVNALVSRKDSQGLMEDDGVSTALSGGDTTRPDDLAQQVEQVTHADVVAVAQMLALDTIYYLTGEEG